jgi:hypothetical protein
MVKTWTTPFVREPRQEHGITEGTENTETNRTGRSMTPRLINFLIVDIRSDQIFLRVLRALRD